MTDDLEREITDAIRRHPGIFPTRIMECNGKTGEVVTCKSSKTVPGGPVVWSVPGEPVIRGLYGR